VDCLTLRLKVNNNNNNNNLDIIIWWIEADKTG
jgi:hypothetical protein